MESKIILCCIEESFGHKQPSDENLQEIFSEFGKVVDIYIFSKGILTKAFIKYEKREDAHSAIEALNNLKTSIGKLKLYPAQKKEIIRKYEDNEALNEKVEKEKQSHKLLRYTTKSTSMNYQLEKAQNPWKGLEEKENSKLNDQEEQNLRQLSNDRPRSIKPEEPLAKHFEVGNSFSQKEKYRANQFLDQSIENLNTHSMFDNRKSKVLIVQKLNLVVSKPKFVANLFGCFGNVVQLLINKTLGYSLIEFQNPNQADNAFKSLNNLSFFGEQLKIKFSKYDQLSSKEVSYENQDLLFYQNDPKAFRYTSDNSIKINEPSSLLHVTGIPDPITPVVLYQLLAHIRLPTKIVQLKRNSKGFMMYLIQFEKLEDSLEVLSILHNKQINEKFLKFSFSHSKVG